MLRFVAQKVQKSRRRAMIVCLATRIFAGGRGWGPHTSGGEEMAAPAFGAGQQVLTLRPDQSRAIQSRCAASQSFAAFTNASNAPPLSSSARLSAGSSGRSATVARRACRSRTWRTSSLWLRRVGFRSRYRGPALVKTRSREFVRVDRETFDIVVPAETTIPSGECDLMVAAVAATASRATATNPVIVRCLVTRTSY